MEQKWPKLDDLFASLTDDERVALVERTAQVDREVEGLKQLRKMARLTQVEMAAELGVQQPAVSRIEKQTDLYLSTLRRFVEAAGGELALVVTLPDTGAMRLTGLGDLERWVDDEEQEHAEDAA